MQDKWSIRDVADALAKHGLIEKQTEQQSCDDAISRQAAIEAFQMFREYYSNRSNKEWVNRIEVVLNQLPPVTPQPKIGHWIKKDGYSDCSECGSHIVTEWDYCPKCGAEMSESEVEE